MSGLSSQRARVFGSSIYGSYATARAIAGLFAVFGWLLVAVGVLAAIGGLAAGAPFNFLVAGIGVGIAALGMLQVAAEQMLRASVDSADYSRQALLLQIALAEGRTEIDLRRVGAEGVDGSAPTLPQETESRLRVVEEGKYKGRKWRRLESGAVEGELLGGRFKEFANLEEYQKFIS